MADPVIIVPYDKLWPMLFMELGAVFRRVLGDVALRIDHIGSTSVPGLDAKPIIDVQISVESFIPLDVYRIPIESVGFHFRENNADLSKRYFRELPGNRRTHIHVRRAGSWSEQMALLFRDYLRTFKHEAERYAQLKYQLANQYLNDRIAYTNGKSQFIREIMVAANNWSQETGWKPDTSDV